jgi:Flagellar hook-length control protein
MNVSASPTPAATCGPAATSRDVATGTVDGAGAGGLDAFIALLAQVTPPVAAVTGQPMPTPAVDTEADDDLPDAVDWALPFLTPPGTPPSTPLDLELPDPSAGGLPTANLATGSTAKEPAGLAALLDAAVASVAGSDANATETDPTQALAAVAPTTTTRAEAVTGTHQLTRTVHVPVADSRWPAQVGHEVRLLVERGVQAATLRVNPEHLGPVEVRIDIVNDKANVVFGAAQAETRAALVDALPKLREMFADSGLALGDTGVRQDTGGAFAEPSTARRNPDGNLIADEGDLATAVQGVATQVGLVDAYA